MYAWHMSAGTFITEDDAWDLWGVKVDKVPGFEVIPFDDRTIREVRVYSNLSPKVVFYIATRSISAYPV
jgi:hypothetical protein